MTGKTVSHYKILEELRPKDGVDGIAFKAWDTKLNRLVVLTLLPSRDQESKRQIMIDAKAALELHHPNLFAVQHIDETPEGQLFTIKEFVKGETLKDRINRGRLSIQESVNITKQGAQGLSAAHARGIVHRNLSPESIVITSDGSVKVDLSEGLLSEGIANIAKRNQITQTGDASRTTAYMSPQQAQGEASDHRTDIWSLGVVLYQMICGQLPFHAEYEQGVIYSILNEEPKSVTTLRPECPSELQRIVGKAMTKNPEERYRNLDEMAADLETLEKQLETRTKPRRKKNLTAEGAENAEKKIEIGNKNQGSFLRDLSVLCGSVFSTAFLAPKESKLKSTIETSVPIQSRRFLFVGAAIVVVLLLTSGIFLWRNTRTVSVSSSIVNGAALQRLAIIPFVNVRRDAQTDYLGYALADQVIDELAQNRGLLVSASSKIREYQNQAIDVQAVGRKLQVDYIMTGNFSKDDNLLRVNLELVNLKTNNAIWQDSLQVEYVKAFAVPKTVSGGVVDRLKLLQGESFGQSPAVEQKAEASDIPQNPLAYDYYLRSIAYPITNEGAARAIEALDKSFQLDSLYAPAYSELGDRYRHVTVYAMGGSATAKKAEQAFQKAVSLNGRLFSTYNGLARLYTESGKSEEAIGLLRRALEMSPNNADVHFSLSYLYRYAGMLEESAREGETALMLDPNNPRFRSVATTYLYLGNLRRSVEVHRLDPESPWSFARIGQIHLRQNQRQSALENFDRVIKMEPASSVGHWAQAMKSYVQGNRKEGLSALDQIERLNPVDGEQLYHLANIHCLLGDNAGCIRALQKAVDGGFFNYPFMARDPFLNAVRNEKDFQRILAQAKEKHEAFKKKFFSQ